MGNYSLPGDSGALVCCIFQDILYPVGIHYLLGLNGSVGYYIELLDAIFQDFMLKHNRESIEVEFVRPKMTGKLKVNRKIEKANNEPVGNGLKQKETSSGIALFSNCDED